jgi:hypothetical protein
MTNELINLNEIGIPQEQESKAITELTQAGGYLPSLRVFGSESGIVKEGKFPMGHWGLYFSADKVVDLSEQVDILVISFRPRASIMASDDQPINFFNPESDNFRTILERSKSKDGSEGHLAGLEYLIWIPSVEKFALFFMGNKTLRRESSNVKAFVGKAATLKIKLIKGKKYTWHGCETLSCEAPFDLPSSEEIKEVYETQFANTQDSDLNIVDSDEPERAR